MSRGRALPFAVTAAVLAATVLLGGCTGGSTPHPTAGPPVTVARAAYALPRCPSLPHRAARPGGLPDLRLPCLGGGPAVTLSDLRGTPTVLNVWAAWCTVCAQEMPVLAAGMRRAGSRVRFFGVHYKAPKKYGEQSAADFGVPFPSVHDTDGDRTVAALHTAAPPQTLFVTADGRIAFQQVGAIRSEAELAALVQRYLGVRL